MNYLKIFYCCLLAITLSGCSKDEGEMTTSPEVPEISDKQEEPTISSDSILVSFKLGGDFKYSEEVLSRSSSDDLYALRVYQSQDKLKDLGVLANVTTYATGYFDSPSNVVLKLAKNRFYHFEMAYVPNAKNVIFKYKEGHYGTPFYAPYSEKQPKLNEVLYSTMQEDGLWVTAASQGKDNSSYFVQECDFNTIERYNGILWNYEPNQSEVKINLYKMMVGFKLIVNDFTEGSITLQSVHGHKYTLKPASNSSTNILDVTVCQLSFPQIIDAHINLKDATDEEFREIITRDKPFFDETIGNIQIHYTDKEGDSMVLYNNHNFVFKRNTKHVLEFSVSDAIENGMISPNIVDEGDEMPESEWEF